MKKIDYEIKNKKLKKMVEKKAKELNMSVDDLIWGYVNRGLMSDNISDEVFWDKKIIPLKNYILLLFEILLKNLKFVQVFFLRLIYKEKNNRYYFPYFVLCIFHHYLFAYQS